MNLHLVDGTFEIFRSYYGAPKATAPDGQEVGATRGILRSLWGLLHDPGVTHVGVAFDTVIESFRNQLFLGYKTGAGVEPDLLAQFPLAEEATAALGLTVWGMLEFEADDAIATAAIRWVDEVERVVIASPDKDFGQLLRYGDRITLLDRIRNTVLDEAGVPLKFGVGPDSIPDYLALVGDTADGIPGVPKWGPKSAGTVLARWRTIEAIPSDPSKWDVAVRGAAGLSETLEANREAAALYKRLATLRYDVPLEESLDALRWRGVDLPRLTALCTRLGDERFLERVPTF
ncbi:MAG: flap endonuclease [Deltaproteobacteria bacterium]|nr:flap endonuclease [Deltaproteobacteria bacterium]